jgi:hypothetical protein
MADLVFVAVMVAFFALALALVRACERIIGPDELAVVDDDRAPATVDEPVAA